MQYLKRVFLLTFVALQPCFADDLSLYLTPYDNGDGIKHIDDAIAGAKTSIKLCCYAFTDNRMLQLLIDAKARGVKVQIVMDKSQSVGAKQKKIVAALKQAGVDLTIGQSAKHRITHSKFMIFDSAVVEEGSYNYSAGAAAQDNTIVFFNSTTVALKFDEFWNRIHDDMEKQQ